jgi:hypothetical protein
VNEQPRIFRKNARRLAILFSCLWALVVGVAATANVWLAAIMGPLLALFLAQAVLGARRESLTISKEELKYSSADGEITEIRLTDVIGFEETTIVWLPDSGPSPAMRLILKSGENKVIALGFPDRAEILSCMREKIGR